MSYGLNVYLLDPTATRALVGSRDDQLLQVIRDRFGDELAVDDDEFSIEIADGAPSAYEALHAVVHGGPFHDDPKHAFQYGYAYKRLCSMTGFVLDNSSFVPFRGNWLEVVDEGLRALRITAVSVATFDSFGRMPNLIPQYDLPCYGEWTHQQCVDAREEFEQTVRAGHAPPLEPEVVEAIRDVTAWLRQAAEKSGFGIVGFVS
jgi:hypothetical protein